jgi:hypothetical protein
MQRSITHTDIRGADCDNAFHKPPDCRLTSWSEMSCPSYNSEESSSTQRDTAVMMLGPHRPVRKCHCNLACKTNGTWLCIARMHARTSPAHAWVLITGGPHTVLDYQQDHSLHVKTHGPGSNHGQCTVAGVLMLMNTELYQNGRQ